MTTIVTQIEDATDIETAHEISKLLLQATHDVYNKCVEAAKNDNPWSCLSAIRDIVATCHNEVDKLMGVPEMNEHIYNLKTPLD